MEEYLKTMGTISSELWKIFKAACLNLNPESDEWWEKISNEMDAAAKKYYETEYEKYARAYAVELIYAIERKVKGGQKND